VVLERANFSDLAAVAARHGVRDVRGILLDLGVSSMQLDRPERGFSFQRDSPLDMRMDDRQELTAAELLKRLPPVELADVLWRYGEEPMARRIAKAVARARARGEPPETTAQLAELVSQAKGGRRGRTHPATQTFQALRIAVNGELAALEAACRRRWTCWRPAGGWR
jgi:16S rRNA (cytosine1402-N4)-methyltransferase